MPVVIVIGLVAALGILLYGQVTSVGQDSVVDLGGDVDATKKPATVKIAQAIATAEGFYVDGSRPQRNHNPGDMTQDLIGQATGKDGPFVVYATDADGWECLYAQVNAWLDGTSRYHSADSSINDLAGLGSETGYSATDQRSWAATVATSLGVDGDTSLGDIA